MKNTTFFLGLWLGFLALLAPMAVAQPFTIGADVVSRYVWRGFDFGESVSVQPTLAFSKSGLEIGTWASYSIAADGAGANEHDIWLSYTMETISAGSFSIGVTDYYFPAPDGPDFFSFDGGGEGAHWIEPYVSYTGPAVAPITLYGAIFAHNDPDHSVYLQASVPAEVEGVRLEVLAGAVAGESAFYGTEGFSLVNLGLSASKGIPITDRFALPVSVAYVLNPAMERSFLVFGLSF